MHHDLAPLQQTDGCLGLNSLAIPLTLSFAPRIVMSTSVWQTDARLIHELSCVAPCFCNSVGPTKLSCNRCHSVALGQHSLATIALISHLANLAIRRNYYQCCYDHIIIYLHLRYIILQLLIFNMNIIIKLFAARDTCEK